MITQTYEVKYLFKSEGIDDVMEDTDYVLAMDAQDAIDAVRKNTLNQTVKVSDDHEPVRIVVFVPVAAIPVVSVDYVTARAAEALSQRTDLAQPVSSNQIP